MPRGPGPGAWTTPWPFARRTWPRTNDVTPCNSVSLSGNGGDQWQGEGVRNSSEVKAGQTWGCVLGLLPLTARGPSAHGFLGESRGLTVVSL